MWPLEELTICYATDILFSPAEERQDETEERFRFRCSGISRMRFIHASNQIPCSSNVFCAAFSSSAILRMEGCLNSALQQYSWNPLDT